jgi:outer membrane protein OmpA-like peptidoglycan-associated protein
VLAQTDTGTPDKPAEAAAPYSAAPTPLLQPGEDSTSAPIQLHMPVTKPARKGRARVESAAVAPSVTEPAPSPAPPAHRHRAASTRTAAPSSAPPESQALTEPGLATAVPFSFDASPLSGKLPPAPKRVAKGSPAPATAVPPPATDSTLSSGLTRRSQIIFAVGAADPSANAIDAIKGLATPLNAALASGASRVQVVAYGGNRGDKSSDARRLSLKRAIIIRQLLIDGGVPSDRIDVRAMGGATDGASLDRVDVFTKV